MTARTAVVAGLFSVSLVSPAAALAGVAVERHASRAARETFRAKREALDDVRRQLETVRARASAARQREQSLLAELEEVDRTLARKRVELTQLDQRIARVEAELARLLGRRGRVAEDTVVQQAALVTRVRVLERLRQTPAPPPMLIAREDAARRRAVSDLARIVRLDLEQLAAFDDTAERLLARQEAVRRARQELLALRQRLDGERTVFDQQAERRRGLLARVRDDRAAQERLAEELGEAARRLEALVRELGRRAQARAVAARPADRGAPRPPAVGLGALRGQLPWPAEGRILTPFGRQVHPRFATATIRHGIDIAAAEGAPIRAVHGGAVLYRGWLKGYGNLIILDHGQGYYTLYAHASEVLVDEGERVKAGQEIARVGDTGSVDGPRLYFEVRYQGRAEDPVMWMGRRP